MDTLTRPILMELLGAESPPCLSLYQPTHRSVPDNLQDPIRYRNLLKEMETSLAKEYASRDTKALLEPFRALVDDGEFWRHTGDGLAVLGSADRFHTFRLQRTVPELVVVANSFHLKPLMRIVQSADRYQVLGLSARSIRFFEGNRDSMDEVDLVAGVPASFEEMIGAGQSMPHEAITKYGSPGLPGLFEGDQGDRGRTGPMDSNSEAFFRVEDQAILDHYSKPSGLPLVLMALAEHHSLFRKISRNPYLLPEGIAIDPGALKPEDVRERVWELVEPHFRQRLASLVEEFSAARSKGLGTENLDEAAEAILAGRVGTLLVEADRQIPGHVDAKTGKITTSTIADPFTDDLLDDLAEKTMRAGGLVVVVPKDRMPTATGIAATYRF